MSLRTWLCRLLRCGPGPTGMQIAIDKRRLEDALRAEGLSKAAAVRIIGRLCGSVRRGSE